MVIKIREGNSEDCGFIAKILLLAENTGSEITSYAHMFQMSNEELQPYFQKIVDNETEGHPLCYKSYLIAEYEGIRAGAISAYVEGELGDSSHLMTGALMSGFDRKKIQLAFKFLAAHRDIQIPKTKGNLQIDCVGTLPEYQKKGLFSSMLEFAETKFKSKGIHASEIQVWKKNLIALNVYKSKGYNIFEEKFSTLEKGNGKLLMRKLL